MKIEISNLTKKFKNQTVVNNVNVTFTSGKIYGIIGRNGSGKSVFLKMICGFYIPSEGTILQDGKNYITDNEFPCDTRALIDGPDFIPDLTGFENLKLLSEIQNKISDETIIQTLKDVNLYEDMNKKYKEYSMGMKQKLGIAQVLMEDPKVMILDEPFNGIDEKSVKLIKNILKAEKQKDKIIIVTSHIKDDVIELADKIYMFDNGELSEKKDFISQKNN